LDERYIGFGVYRMDSKSVAMNIREHEKAMAKAIAIALVGWLFVMFLLVGLVYVISFWL